MYADKQRKHHREMERKRYTQLHNKIIMLSEKILGPSKVAKKWDQLRRIFLCCRSLKWICRKLKGKNLSKFLPQEVKLFEAIDAKVMKKSCVKKKSGKRKKGAHIVFLKKTEGCLAESTSSDKSSSGQLYCENQVQVEHIDSSALECTRSNAPIEGDGNASNDSVNYQVDSSGYDATFCESSLSSFMCTDSSQQTNLVAQSDHESIVVPVGNFNVSVHTKNILLNSAVPKSSVPVTLHSSSHNLEHSFISSSLFDQQFNYANMYFSNSCLEPSYLEIGDADNSCDSTEKEEKYFLLEREWGEFNCSDMLSDCSSPSPVKLGKDMEELMRRCLPEE